MSRQLSSNAMAEMTAQETGEVYAVLLTLDHDDLDAPIRVNNSGADITSNGENFIAFPFDIVLPDDPEGAAPRARLAIDNVDRQIISAVRGLSSAPTILMQVIRVSDPDVIEAEWPDFKMTNISYDAKTVQGDLTIEEFTTEPYPASVFSPSLFPGLF